MLILEVPRQCRIQLAAAVRRAHSNGSVHLFAPFTAGRLPCPSPSRSPSPSPPMTAATCKPSSAPPRRPRPWPCAAASSCGLPPPTVLPTAASLPNWAATDTPSACGVLASPPTDYPACKTRRVRAARLAFPPEQRATVVEIGRAHV